MNKSLSFAVSFILISFASIFTPRDSIEILFCFKSEMSFAFSPTALEVNFDLSIFIIALSLYFVVKALNETSLGINPSSSSPLKEYFSRGINSCV